MDRTKASDAFNAGSIPVGCTWRFMNDGLNKIVRFFKNNMKIAAPVVLIALTAFVTYLALVLRNSNADRGISGFNSEPLSEETENQPTAEQEQVPVTLSLNTDPALSDFIASYYLCLSNGDVDMLKTLVDTLETKDMLVKAEQSRFLDYEVGDIYFTPGYDENSVIVFPVTNVIFDSFPEQKLPSYEGFYVIKNTDGSFLIKNTEPSAEETEYINGILISEDVVELGNRITAEYNDIITASPELLTYMKELDTIVSTEAGEKLAALNSGEEIELPEIEEPDEDTYEEETKTATVNQSVNVRVSDSINADKMGQVNGGQTVIVLDVKGNGWVAISYNDSVGYVKSEYLTMDVDIDSLETIGTVTAKETLNIRASASTDGMIMGSFAKDSTARLVEEKDGWCEVIYNNKVCYLSSQYLDIQLD